jgi:mono/diheme cytochrome c family protein
MAKHRGVRTLFILAGLAAAAAAGGAIFVYSGAYNIAATEQHTAPVYWLMEATMRRSIRQRAEDIAVPDLGDPAMIERGLRLYRAHCVQCHGAPGVAPDAFALGLLPIPANLSLTAREWKRPAELYWAVKFGIKMSGMPAWEFRLDDRELWAVVAFMRVLPTLSAQDYASAARAVEQRAAPASQPQPDPAPQQRNFERGKIALQQYACTTCHQIPGVVGAHNPVGPPLDGIATRKFLAGVLPNTPQNMIRWLRFPQAVDAGTAMPDLGVSERDAHDIAAYLDTLR